MIIVQRSIRVNKYKSFVLKHAFYDQNFLLFFVESWVIYQMDLLTQDSCEFEAALMNYSLNYSNQYHCRDSSSSIVTCPSSLSLSLYFLFVVLLFSRCRA